MSGKNQTAEERRGMRCHECEKRHLDWLDDGKHTVDGPYHAGIIQRYECGNCGAITEVSKQ